MPFSNPIENAILSHYARGVSWTQPAAVWVGLSTTSPTRAGTNITEATGTGYARIQITTAQWAAPSAGSMANNVDKDFAQAGSDWSSGTPFVAFILYDASTAGNFLGYVTLTQARSVVQNETPRIPSGLLVIAFTGT